MWTVGTVKRFENALFDFQERGSVGPRKLYSRHFNLVLIRDFHPGLDPAFGSGQDGFIESRGSDRVGSGRARNLSPVARGGCRSTVLNSSEVLREPFLS